MRILNSVTLIAIAGNRHAETIAALYKSLQQITPARTVFITNREIQCTGIETINVGGLDTWEAYNEFCIKRLNEFFTTDFCLLVQWDGYVLDSEQWDDCFLEYDYIGAKWLDIGKPFNVGNGGFSMRSKLLQTALARDSFIEITCPEDNAICKIYSPYLEFKYGIKYAPEEIADKFSFELNEPLAPTFGFHGFHWPSFRPTVVIKRSFALGDVIMCEPVMEYFHRKGYQVALDTAPEFDQLFIPHHFPIIPKRHLNPKLPYKEINLDYAYEVKPKQNHLESYYDFSEVPAEDRSYRNPRLSLQFSITEETKLFKKYCVLHIDERDEPHRNIYGINWDAVVDYLADNGYKTILIGNGKHPEVKEAVEMKTPGIPFLKWVIAGADMFIGIDSGPSHIASAFDIPSIVFTGSVDLSVIHPSLDNKIWIHRHKEQICHSPFCWHNSVTQKGQDCYISKTHPPCTFFQMKQLGEAINQIIEHE